MKSEMTHPVLLVDDDHVDVKTVRRLFERLQLPNPLYVAANGKDALDYLRHEGKYEQKDAAPRPGVIFLDLNMPVMNGLEFLKEMKSDSSLKTIPVVMLTTSNDSREVCESFKLGSAGYFTKPFAFDEFASTIQTMHSYWTSSRLPDPDVE